MSDSQNISCYLCGSTDCTMIHDHIRYDMSPRPYQCNRCGFVYLYPRMTPEHEKEFYEKLYRSTYEQQDAESLWTTSLPEAQLRAKRFKHFFTPETRVLEVGCACGYFLFSIKDYVKTVTGVELTTDFITFAREKGLNVRASLDDIDDESCDLIFLFHVLEHIEDPIKFLRTISKKLSPTGKLIIEVPNVEDILLSVYKIKSHLDFYWEVAHKYYFSQKSLREVLTRAGYRTEIYPFQRYDLSNHMYWMQYGKPGGQGRYNVHFTSSLLKEYEKCLKDQFLCDTIYAVADVIR